jgi:hypothetical protein
MKLSRLLPSLPSVIICQVLSEICPSASPYKELLLPNRPAPMPVPFSTLTPDSHHWPRRDRTPRSSAAAISERSGISAASAAAWICDSGLEP